MKPAGSSGSARSAEGRHSGTRRAVIPALVGAMLLAAAGCQALVQFDPPDGGARDEGEPDEATAPDADVGTDGTIHVVPGESCITDIDCNAGQVCDVRSCGVTLASICVEQESSCTAVWAPVCGCDGVTYGNDCERRVAGRRLRHVGECGFPPAAPLCALDPDGDPGWFDFDPAAPGRPWAEYCWSACTECVAECRFAGEPTEGWYASCRSGPFGGCEADDTIVLGDCG